MKSEGEPVLCRTDEIGEILLSSKPNEVDTDSSYFGLKGLTEKIFKAHPIDESSNGRVESACYTRTGLLGYLNPVSSSSSASSLMDSGEFKVFLFVNCNFVFMISIGW